MYIFMISKKAKFKLKSVKLDMSKTNVNIIWKNKDSIIDAFENFSSKMKKIRTTPDEHIGKALLKWFMIQ